MHILKELNYGIQTTWYMAGFLVMFSSFGHNISLNQSLISGHHSLNSQQIDDDYYPDISCHNGTKFANSSPVIIQTSAF